MATASDRPQWLEAFLKLERAIGSRVENVVTSDAYFEFVAQANRARNRFTQKFESVQEEWLHLFNLPAGTDVRRLREQVSRLERELEALSLGLADRDDAAADKPRPKPRPRRQAKSSSDDE